MGHTLPCGGRSRVGCSFSVNSRSRPGNTFPRQGRPPVSTPFIPCNQSIMGSPFFLRHRSFPGSPSTPRSQSFNCPFRNTTCSVFLRRHHSPARKIFPRRSRPCINNVFLSKPSSPANSFFPRHHRPPGTNLSPRPPLTGTSRPFTPRIQFIRPLTVAGRVHPYRLFTLFTGKRTISLCPHKAIPRRPALFPEPLCMCRRLTFRLRSMAISLHGMLAPGPVRGKPDDKKCYHGNGNSRYRPSFKLYITAIPPCNRHIYVQLLLHKQPCVFGRRERYRALVCGKKRRI